MVNYLGILEAHKVFIANDYTVPDIRTTHEIIRSIIQRRKIANPEIEMFEGHQYTFGGELYPSYEDALQAKRHQVLYEMREGTEGYSPEAYADYVEKRDWLKKYFPEYEVREDSSLPKPGQIVQVIEEGVTKKVLELNPRLLTTDTLGHEYGHIIIDSIGGMANPIVKHGKRITHKKIRVRY